MAKSRAAPGQPLEEIDEFLAVVRADAIRRMGPFPSRGKGAPRPLLRFRRSLLVETDRGCAMAAAAYIDAELAKLLRRFLVSDKKAVDRMVDHPGPLASFGARIDACYLLGLISRNEQRDLHIVRKIRNAFAHRPDDVRLSDPDIAARCRELVHDPRGKPLTPKRKLIRVMMALLGAIHSVAKQTRHRRGVKNIDMNRARARMAKLLGEPKSGDGGAA